MNIFSRKMKGGGELPPKPAMTQVFRGLTGGCLAIAGTAYLALASGTPLLMAPFGATCTLLFAAPDTPLAQPRNVVGGHVLSTFVGLLFLEMLGTGLASMALAVGCAIALMQITRTVHAPAGADPLVVFMTPGITWGFLVAPVLSGSVILVLIALVLNNLGNRKWPSYWF